MAHEVNASGQARLVRWIDNTPPTMTFQAPSKTFLNTGDSDVRATASDAEAGLDPEAIVLFLDGILMASPVTPGDPFWHTAEISATLIGIPEGIHQLHVEARDRAGNKGQALKEVIVDLTPPTIMATVDPSPNAAGWHKTTVIVRFDCSDNLSGIETCPEPVIVGTEGANQVITGTAVDRAGNSAITTVTLNIDKTAPTLSTVITPPPNSNGWNRTDVTVSFAATDTLSDVAEVTAPITLTTEGANQIVVGTAIDLAGNEATISVIVNIDKTPPNLSTSANPSPNSNGWHNTDATVSFVAIDALSGVAEITAPITVTTEGAHQVITGTATDLAGNSATTSVTLNIDKTPPGLVAIINPPPNNNGWNKTDVTISFEATDSLSGLSEGTAPITLTTEGANQVITGTATDLAGNTTTRSVTLNLDKAPPSVGITSPSHGVMFNVPEVTVIGTVNDLLSGVASVTCNEIPVSASGMTFTCELSLNEGVNVIIVRATDLGGNVGTASITVILDTIPPNPPVVFDVTSPTLLRFQAIAGEAEPESRIDITGGRDPASVKTFANGLYMVNVPLRRNDVNTLSLTATDAVGNTSAPTEVTIIQSTDLPLPGRGEAAIINVVSGNNQEGVVGEMLPQLLEVIVTDPEG
ncbi:MAG: hypothetical protein HY731_07615, partial [Candidatus Tectomicrobia bacterium]|nr:hypothetical protein [Candidatus Tectomicrobia bacterium]